MKKKSHKRIYFTSLSGIKKMMDSFVRKRGDDISVIITTKEKKEALIQWISSEPKNGFVSLNFSGAKVVTPDEVMFL